MPIDKANYDAYNSGMTYQDLMNHFKTQKAAASAIGVKQPSISLWKKRGIPEPRQYQIQVLTGGMLKAGA